MNGNPPQKIEIEQVRSLEGFHRKRDLIIGDPERGHDFVGLFLRLIGGITFLTLTILITVKTLTIQLPEIDSMYSWSIASGYIGLDAGCLYLTFALVNSEFVKNPFDWLSEFFRRFRNGR